MGLGSRVGWGRGAMSRLIQAHIGEIRELLICCCLTNVPPLRLDDTAQHQAKIQGT